MTALPFRGSSELSGPRNVQAPFARCLLRFKRSNQAQEAVSELGSEELKKSFDRISQLEEANKKLQEERSRIQ